MALLYNGVAPTTIKYGSTNLTKVIYGSTTVWQRSQGILIPRMTGPASPYGRVSSSAEFKDNTAYGWFMEKKGFDSWWIFPNGTAASGNWVQYAFVNPVMITSVTFSAGTDGGGTRTWYAVLEGSMDGGTWYQLTNQFTISVTAPGWVDGFAPAIISQRQIKYFRIRFTGGLYLHVTNTYALRMYFSSVNGYIFA